MPALLGQSIHLPVRKDDLARIIIGGTSHVIVIANAAVGERFAFRQQFVAAGWTYKDFRVRSAFRNEQTQRLGGILGIIKKWIRSVIVAIKAQGKIDFLQI